MFFVGVNFALFSNPDIFDSLSLETVPIYDDYLQWRCISYFFLAFYLGEIVFNKANNRVLTLPVIVPTFCKY